MIKELQIRPFARPLLVWIAGIMLQTVFSCCTYCWVLLLLPVIILTTAGLALRGQEHFCYETRWLWGVVFLSLLLFLSIQKTACSQFEALSEHPASLLSRWAREEQQRLLEPIAKLNLTDEEKTELIRLLQENYRPENRVYRYNFFYDNCATRPRDKIEESIAGKVIYPVEPQDGSRTFREIVHQYCKGHPWARFGIDLCIGSEADRPITQRQMMFAPFYLMDAFAGAQITGDSIQRPLVTDSELIVDATPEEDESFWIPTPLQSALLLFILTAAATIYGIRRRTGLWGVDLILFGTAGIAGCILAFLVLFSEHPAVSSNFLLFVFHPGQLLFLPYIIYCVRKGKKCWYLTLNLIILTLFIVLFPVIPQRFDFAVVPLALCLLIRSASNLIVTSKKK